MKYLIALLILAVLFVIGPHLVKRVMNSLKRGNLDNVDLNATIVITGPGISRVFTGGLRANPELRSLWEDHSVVIDGKKYRRESILPQYFDPEKPDLIRSYYSQVSPIA